jgi:hypothetical protein
MAALARYRITFSKTEAMRFTGHLDLHRTWERTFRRAGLPLAYSEGFNPHPKINIGAALPLGCLSRGDLIDAWLERERADVAHLLPPPPGIRSGRARLETAEPVPDGSRPRFMRSLGGIPEPRDVGGSGMMARSSSSGAPRQDVRSAPLVEELGSTPIGPCCACADGAGGRAAGEVVQALDLI